MYKRCAIISPWAVGRYASADAFASKKTQVRGDLRWCQGNNIVYAPVAFPGFSWRNTKTSFKNGSIQLPTDAPYDAIPRLGGKFFKTQLDSYIGWGADGIFVAIFDEMDEGTAIFKLADKSHVPSNASQLNPDGRFVYIEDGLGADYYLKLAGSASAKLKE